MSEFEESLTGINLNSSGTNDDKITPSTNNVTEESKKTEKQMSEEKMKYYNSYNSNDQDNSSDEDRPINSDDVEVDATDDKDGVDVETNEYAILTDDFGDFVSSEDFVDENSFADFSKPLGLFRNNESVSEDTDEKESDNQPAIVEVAPVRPAIAPLSKEKIATIKDVMSRIKIGHPSGGAAAIADHIHGARLRLGDEI